MLLYEVLYFLLTLINLPIPLKHNFREFLASTNLLRRYVITISGSGIENCDVVFILAKMWIFHGGFDIPRAVIQADKAHFVDLTVY